MACSKNRWKIWCNTENTWALCDWSDYGSSAPTECPNNPAHSVKLDSASLEEVAIEEKTNPVRGDYVVIEDSGDDCEEKVADIGNMVAGVGGQDICVQTIRDPTTPYWKFDQVTYVGIPFPFHGTTMLGIPSAIKVYGRSKDPGKQGDFRVYDVTNAETIAEVTGITNTNWSTIDIAGITNLPADYAVWEVQGRKDTGEVQSVFWLVEFS